MLGYLGRDHFAETLWAHFGVTLGPIWTPWRDSWVARAPGRPPWLLDVSEFKRSMPLRSGSPLVDKNHQLYEGVLKVPSRLIAYTQQLERGSIPRNLRGIRSPPPGPYTRPSEPLQPRADWGKIVEHSSVVLIRGVM